MSRMPYFASVAVLLLAVAIPAADQTVNALGVNASSPAGIQVTTGVADGTNIFSLARFGPTSGNSGYDDTEQRIVVYGSGDNTNARTALVLQEYCSAGVRSGILANNGVNTSRIPGGTNGSIQLFGDSAQPLQFGTGNAARMTIDASGNVGIGNVSPTSRLSVVGGARFGGQIDENISNTTNGLSIKDNAANVSLGVGQTTSSAVELVWAYNATPANAYAALGTFGNANPIVYSASYHQFSAGNVGIGVVPAAGNGLLQLASGTTQANGIALGTDTFLYRGGANNLRTNGVFYFGDATGFVNASGGSAYFYGAGTGPTYVGTTTAQSLGLVTNNAVRVWIDTAGDVGFGTGTGGTYNGNIMSVPSDIYPEMRWRSGSTWKATMFADANLGDMYFDVSAGRSTVFRDSQGGAGGTILSLAKSGSTLNNGNLGLGIAPTAGNGLLQLASGTDKSKGIAFGTDTFLYRALAVDGTTVLKTDGVMAIGGTTNYNANGINTLGSKLFVRGKIAAQEVVVTLQSWADHVFAAGYRLPALPEVAAFIQANHHLPGIPSEAEIVRDGMGTGDMLAKHMAKIEELTLYAIKADQRANEAEHANAALLSQVQQLKADQDGLRAELRRLAERLK